MPPHDLDDGRSDDARPPLRRWRAPVGRERPPARRPRGALRAGIVIIVACPTPACGGDLRFGGSARSAPPDGSGLTTRCVTCHRTYALVHGDIAVQHTGT